MGLIDSGSKSSRLLASRRYTHNTLTTAQEAFTKVLDLRSEEIYTRGHLIPTSSLPHSGSSQKNLTYTTQGQSVTKYWYRQKLTKSNVNNEVWFFLNPTGSNDGVGAQLINDNQVTNFVSPKYSIASLATSTTEDTTPGYLATVFKSSEISSSFQTSSLSSGDIVSTNDYQFDYKTGIVQFLNSDKDPSDSEYIYMTVYQYVGDTLKTGLEVQGAVTASNLLVTGNSKVDGDLTLGGDITIGDDASDALTITADLTSHLIPDTSDTYNLGSDSQRWNDLYLSGSMSASGGPVDIDSATTVAIDATTTLSAKGAGGASFGDDTGTWEFDGAGAVSETGITTFSLTPSSTVDVDAGGAITIDGVSLTVGGDGDTNIIKLTGPVTASTHISASGNLSATGNLDIDGTANIEGNTTLQADLSVVDINASGHVTASGNVSASGNIYSTGNLDVDGTSNLEGNVTMQADLSVVDINASGDITGSVISGSSGAFTSINVDGGTVDGITSLTAGGNLDIGSYDLRAATITADGLTSGRVVFAGTDGVLSDDSDLSFSEDTLTATRVTSTHITASGDISASGDLSATGNLDIDGTTNLQGNVTVQNDLDVTGTLTATEVHTTFVSASIAKASGSNVFGDDAADSHQFTGSLSVSGSATVTGSTTINGVLTANSVVVDNITIDGTEIDLSSGDLTLDVAGDIELNADGGDVTVKDDSAVLLDISATKISGSVTSTGSFGALTVADGVTSTLSPISSDGVALGTTALQWSDLFLAEGAVINWDNGDFTATQTNNLLDLDGGSTRVDKLEIDSANDYLDVDTDLKIVAAADITLDPGGNNVKPGSDSTDDLGLSGTAWRTLYVDAIEMNNQGSIAAATHITASSNISASGNLSATGNLDIDGTSNLEGDVTLQNDLAVTGHITASGNISSSGTIYADNFQSTGGDSEGISFADDLSITGHITASGDISASGDLSATGNLDIDGTSNLEGDVTLQGDLSVVNITGTGNVSSSVTSTGSFGALTVADGVTSTLSPVYPDGAALGSDTNMWSDLFLAEGGVINLNNGGITLTETSDVLVQAGGNLRVPRLEIDGANDYIDVSTDLKLVAAADITLDPGGNNVKPGGDSADDLGVSGTAWRTLYVDSIKMNGQGSIDGATYITGSSVSASSGDFTTINVDGGTVDGITSLTAGGNLDIGGYDLRAATITADGLSSGRVVFAGTAGVLSDDSDLTFSGATLTATNLTGTTIKDFTTISGSSASTGSFGRVSTSTLDLSSIQGNWTNAGNTIADLGSVTTVDINAGTVDAITSLTVANDVDVGNYKITSKALEASDLTAGRVTFAGTNGLLADDSDLTFSTATLSATFISATHITASGNISSSGTIYADNFQSAGGDVGGISFVDDLNITGNITASGAVSASSGAFTSINVDGGTVDGATIGASSHTTIKGTTIDATTDFTIDGLVITADTITNDAGLSIVASSGDITLDPAGNNVLPGGDSADDLGVSGTAWRTLYVDSIEMNDQGAIAGVTHITASGAISASGDILSDGRIYEQGTSVVDHATAMAIVFGG